jgi:[ribosomal protein S18]-alanine N-acetyltransferase
MNALLRPAVADGHCLVPMTTASLDAVLQIEQRAYAFPWTRGNFIDSLAAGYAAQRLVNAQQQLLGYFVAMEGVEEMHLLNITVDPRFHGQGHASTLYHALHAQSLELGAHKLWLEVRQSNQHAQQIYRHFGFESVGVRKGYYPAPLGQREDAVVMGLQLRCADRDPP